VPYGFLPPNNGLKPISLLPNLSIALLISEKIPPKPDLSNPSTNY